MNHMDDFSVSYFALGFLCYGLLILFVIVDGLRHSLSLKSLLLTLPHLVASLALVRSTLIAFKQHNRLHAGLFFIGLLTFSAMA